MENYSALTIVCDLKQILSHAMKILNINIISKVRLRANATHRKYHIFIKLFFELIRKRQGANLKIRKKFKSICRQ